MNRTALFILAFLSTFLFTACSANPSSPANSQSAAHNERIILLESILSESTKIDELFYEEAPITSFYSGGIKIENTSKIWFKINILKTEHITRFYKNDELLDSEINGEIYDYSTLKTIRYYIGQYPDQARSYSIDEQDTLIIPREQTILWYLDKITPDLSPFAEEMFEGEECLIVEILKNNLGSTKVWVSTAKGLPVKIVNNYNENISERTYCNFKVGKGAVTEQDLQVPPNALTLVR